MSPEILLARRAEGAMRILIADDEPGHGGPLAEVLRGWGYEPVLVHDGAEALASLCGADAPQLALLDWLMPGLDGIQVCREVRRTQPWYSYLILVTGHGGRQQRIDGLQAGADDFLAKPVDVCELKARLRVARQIIDAQEQLRRQATRDALTGLWNRAAILALLDQELERSRREGRPLAVALVDLDHFKRINDTLGHLAGDQVLQQVAQRMQSALRGYDAVGRYGGEEFLAVLPGCGSADALELAERLRRRLSDEPVAFENSRLAVTLSVGIVACDGTKPVSAVHLLRAADESLYRAKAAGRNRCVLTREDPPMAAESAPTPPDRATPEGRPSGINRLLLPRP
jgi:two-component system cell cycle response regulator